MWVGAGGGRGGVRWRFERDNWVRCRLGTVGWMKLLRLGTAARRGRWGAASSRGQKTHGA